MRILIVYSSVTGNTRLVAEAIASTLGSAAEVYPVNKAPKATDFDLALLGFWVYRGKPDPRMVRYMQTVHGKNVAVFGTLAAWPDSPHAHAVLSHTQHILSGNTFMGSFLCLGKLPQKRFHECMDPAYSNKRHPMTSERKARLQEGQKHPDAEDLFRAALFFQNLTLRLLEKQ